MDSSAHPTRLAILERALGSFGEVGFEKASFKSIMEGSGHPPSLLVYHFGTKEKLYLETFKYLFSIYPFRVPDGAACGPATSREAALELLEAQLRQLAVEVAPDPSGPDQSHLAGAKVWMHELEDPRPILHDLLREQLSPFVQNIRACMRRLHPELPEREADFLGVVAVGHVVGHTTMFGLNQIIWGPEYSRIPRERAVELIVRSCLQGIEGPA